MAMTEVGPDGERYYDGDDTDLPLPTPVVRPWQQTSGLVEATWKGEKERTLHRAGLTGPFYDDETPPEVIAKLEHARLGRYRIRLCYGDKTTGADWQEIHDVEGYVGMTTGCAPVTILVYNTRSLGGGAILTSCIVKIKTTGKEGAVLYKHPLYHIPPDPQQEEPDGRITSFLHHLTLQVQP
jgi:hypothetical protein